MRRVAVVAVVVMLTSGCGWITRADVRDDGKPAAGGVTALATSADGSRTILLTGARLTAQDTNDDPDIYLKTDPGSTIELQSGRFSHGANIQEATIGRNGDAIAFTTAKRLTTEDLNNAFDVYEIDPNSGALVRVSVATNGELPIVSVFGPRFVSDDAAISFYGDDASNHAHLYVRDLQDESTREIPIPAGQDPVQLDGEAERLVVFDAASTISVVRTDTGQDLGPDCTGTTPVLSNNTLVAMFDGGTGCPTGAARYDMTTKAFTPFSMPADADFWGLDDSEGILLWRRNDGSQHFFTRSFVTGRDQLVSDAGGISAAVPAISASLSGDGSTVAEVMPPFPADVGNTQPRAYLHTSMVPIASNVMPSSAARGETVTVQMDVADSFQGDLGASFGPGVDVTVLGVAPVATYRERVTLRVSVHADASTGLRSLLLAEVHPIGPAFGGCLVCFRVT